MQKTKNKSNYYPETVLDSNLAQKQPYPSSTYYPYPMPTNTFRLNPLVLPSLKTTDIDNLQDVIGKGIQEQRSNIVGTKLENDSNNSYKEWVVGEDGWPTFAE